MISFFMFIFCPARALACRFCVSVCPDGSARCQAGTCETRRGGKPFSLIVSRMSITQDFVCVCDVCVLHFIPILFIPFLIVFSVLCCWGEGKRDTVLETHNTHTHTVQGGQTIN